MDIQRAALQAYLARVLRRPVELLGMRPLRGSSTASSTDT
jgi:hypothetical protein